MGVVVVCYALGPADPGLPDGLPTVGVMGGIADACTMCSCRSAPARRRTRRAVDQRADLGRGPRDGLRTAAAFLLFGASPIGSSRSAPPSSPYQSGRGGGPGRVVPSWQDVHGGRRVSASRWSSPGPRPDPAGLTEPSTLHPPGPQACARQRRIASRRVIAPIASGPSRILPVPSPRAGLPASARSGVVRLAARPSPGLPMVAFSGTDQRGGTVELAALGGDGRQTAKGERSRTGRQSDVRSPALRGDGGPKAVEIAEGWLRPCSGRRPRPDQNSLPLARQAPAVVSSTRGLR
jgi:hypothetical protein